MNNAQNQNDQIKNNEDLKPDVSDLQEQVGNTKKIQAIAVIVFSVIILAFLIISLLNRSDKEEDKTTNQKQEIGTTVKTNSFAFKQDKNDTVPLKTLFLDEKKEEVEEEKPVFPSKKSYGKVLKGSSSLLVNGGNSSDFSSEQSSKKDFVDFTDNAYTINKDGKVVKKADTNNYSYDKDYDNNGVFSPKAAKVGQFDPNLYLAKGTYIGCSLDTRLVSTIKGGIACTVSENVYSSNGVTLLIEKGSKITGYFVSGQMNDGMDRIFVTWNEIRTPNNIIIPVSSGASDSLGGSGMEGYVDHHWLERFGSAILLSVIDDAFNVLLNGRAGTKSNPNIDYTEHTRETTRNMADTALQKFINIQPTLYKNHGDIVGVYVNRDIDFSKVYRLKIKKRG